MASLVSSGISPLAIVTTSSTCASVNETSVDPVVFVDGVQRPWHAKVSMLLLLLCAQTSADAILLLAPIAASECISIEWDRLYN